MKQFYFFLLSLLTVNLLSAQSKHIEKLLFEGKYQEAIPLLQKQIKKDTSSSSLYFSLAKSYENIDKNNLAIINYRKALQLQPNYPIALLNLSNCLFYSGNYKKAISNLKQLNNLTTNNYRGSLLLAKTYTTLGEYKEAIKIYNRLIKKDTTNANLYKLLGKTKSRAQDHVGATSAYLKSYQLNSNNLAVIIYLSQNFYDMSAYKQAISYINKGLKEYPNNTILLKKKAKCLMGLKWYSNAMLIYQDMAEHKQLNANGYKMLGVCHMQMHNYNKALDAFNKCGKSYDKDPMLNYYQGYCFLKNKQYNKAIEHINTALFYITSPSKSDMHLQLAKAYGMIREFAKSIEQYKKSYELNPKNDILYEIATTYEELDSNKQKALEYYSKYIQNATQKESKHYEYAKSRILHIKEKIHWEK